MTEVCFHIALRDKAAHCARAIRSALEQTYSPLEVLVTDQGSTDGSFEVALGVLTGYSGPHSVRLLRCPPEICAVPYGMAGFNANFLWACGQTDAELIVSGGADDYFMPERTARCVEAWRRTGASAIGTATLTETEGKRIRTRWPPADGWLEPESLLLQGAAGTMANAVTRKLVDFMGPGLDDMVFDLWVPFHAMLLDGHYFLAEPLAVRVDHGLSVNVGADQRAKAAERAGDLIEADRIQEQAWADLTASMSGIHLAAQVAGNERVLAAVQHGLAAHAFNWSLTRKRLDDRRRGAI